MIDIFADQQLDQAFDRSKDLLDKVSDTFFSTSSVVTFILSIAAAMVLGRFLAYLMRRFARMLSTRADKTQDLKEVNRLRRIETLTILISALVRAGLVVFALYFWWVYSHPGAQASGIIGASALVAIVAGATIAPILRDLAYGGVMMAEHWFGVGDHVKLEPFGDLQGVVERVTLRSTRIRGLNGEIIWVSNQNIQGVRVSPKGVRTLALDIFVSNLEKGLALIEQTNMRLPSGPLMVVRPLQIMHKDEVGPKLWHIVAVGETAPGREWLLQDYAVKIMGELDEELDKSVLENEPIAHYSDGDADKRFARTVQNARKSNLQRKQLPSPEEFAQQLLLKPLRKSGEYARSKTKRHPKKHS